MAIITSQTLKLSWMKPRILSKNQVRVSTSTVKYTKFVQRNDATVRQTTFDW